ncbi:hypothetical protein HD554DRAFT_1999936, partial [Boletus coccyginus]
REINLEISIAPANQKESINPATALLDSEANAIYIDSKFTHELHLPMTKLEQPIPVYNVNG